MPKKNVKRYYRVPRLRVFGAGVYLHISTIVVASLLGVTTIKSPIYGAVAIASYFSIIFTHEFGHAFVATRQGYIVQNIVIGWWHGSCECAGARDEWREILFYWGGVLAQFSVAALVFTIAALIPGDDPGYFGPVLVFLGYVNFAVAIVNLAPAPGFDGSVAWRIVPYLLAGRRPRRRRKSATSRARKKWGA